MKHQELKFGWICQLCNKSLSPYIKSCNCEYRDYINKKGIERLQTNYKKLNDKELLEIFIESFDVNNLVHVSAGDMYDIYESWLFKYNIKRPFLETRLFSALKRKKFYIGSKQIDGVKSKWYYVDRSLI